jgi:hypothetical protein
MSSSKKSKWIFIGYAEAKPKGDGFELVGASEIIVFDYKTEKEALAAAKKILKRDLYHLKQVSQWETGDDLSRKQNNILDKALKLMK